MVLLLQTQTPRSHLCESGSTGFGPHRHMHFLRSHLGDTDVGGPEPISETPSFHLGAVSESTPVRAFVG